MTKRNWMLAGSAAALLGAALAWRFDGATATADGTVQVLVDAQAPGTVVSSQLGGVNVAIWDGDLHAAERLSQLRRAGVTTLRYPGGALSDAYHWSENQVEGRKHKEPSPTNVFAALNEALGSEAYITVNYGSGTPQEAAAWVAWANGTTDAGTVIGRDVLGRDWHTVGHWARLRAAAPLEQDDGLNFLRAGHPAPYGWRHFEIGNEIFGGWAHDRRGEPGSGLPGRARHPRSYAENSAAFMAAMRAVDPSVELGIVLYHGEPDDDRPLDDRCQAVCDEDAAVVDAAGRAHVGWNPIVLRTLAGLGARPDFGVVHIYPQQPGKEDDRELLEAPAQVREIAGELRRQIDRWWSGPGAGADIGIALSEYNSVTGQPGKQSLSVVNALYYADVYGELMASDIDAAHWWILTASIDFSGHSPSHLHGRHDFGSYAWISNGARVDGREAPPRNHEFPNYHVARLTAPWRAPGVVRLPVQARLHRGSAYATRADDGTVHLLLINKNPTRTLSPTVGLRPDTTRRYRLQVSSYGAAEAAADEPPRHRPPVTVASGFTHAVEPYSVHLLSFRPVAGSAQK